MKELGISLFILLIPFFPMLMRIFWVVRNGSFDGLVKYNKERFIYYRETARKILKGELISVLRGMKTEDVFNGILFFGAFFAISIGLIINGNLYVAALIWLFGLWAALYIFIMLFADAPSKITRESAIFIYGAVFALMVHHLFSPFIENEYIFYSTWAVITFVVPIAALSIYKDSLAKDECKLCKIHRYFWRFILILVASYVLMYSLGYELHKTTVMAVYAASIVLLRIADLRKPMQVVKVKEKYSGVTYKVLNVVLFIVGMIITFVAIHYGYIVEMLFGAFIFADIIQIFSNPKEGVLKKI